MTRRRATLLGLLFVVVAALSVAGWTLYRGYANNIYRAIPASAWPAINGVHLASAQSYEGHSCCESAPGALHATLVVSGEKPLGVVAAGLVASGWTVRHCDTGLVVSRDSLLGAVALARHGDTSATAVVTLWRVHGNGPLAPMLLRSMGCATT